MVRKHYDRISMEVEASGLHLQQLRLSYEKNPVPFALMQIDKQDGVARDAAFAYVNPAFARLVGMQAQSLLGRGYYATFGKPGNDKLLQTAEIADGKESNALLEIQDSLGRRLQINCFSMTPGFLGCQVQDITVQHYLNESDIIEFAKFQKIVDGGVLVTTLSAPHKIIYSSEALYTLLGYPSLLSIQQYVEENTLFSVIHPADIAKLNNMIDSLSCQESIHCILRVRHKSGSYLWLSIRGKRVTMQNETLVVTITHDITEETERLVYESKISRQMILNIGSQYYATYYVDEETGQYFTVQQGMDDFHQDVPPSGDYLEAMQHYIHTFVHPEDRMELSDEMTIPAFLALSHRSGDHLLMTRQFRRRFGNRFEWVEVLMSMHVAQQNDEKTGRILTLAFRNIHNEKLAEMEKRYLEVFSYAVTHTYEMVLEFEPSTNLLYELKLGENGLYRVPRYEATIEERIRFATIHIHPDDIRRFVDEISPEIRHSLDLSHKVTFEYRRRGDEEETYRWCSYSIRAFTQGSRKLIILFVKDIHDTKMRHLREQKRLQTAVVDAERRIHEKNSQLITYYGKTIELMSSVVEYRSLESGEHVRRIKSYTAELLRSAIALFPEQELSDEKIRSITEASALHDVGKIGVPDNILLKPARLTPEEFEVMKQHTVIGADIAREIPCVTEKKDEYYYGYYIARYHHERFDGNGYPEGLRGDDIPFCAQIVAIADVYDALTTVRVYKGAYSDEQAFDMIMNGECGVFSPKMLYCFNSVRERFAAIHAGIHEGLEKDTTAP